MHAVSANQIAGILHFNDKLLLTVEKKLAIFSKSFKMVPWFALLKWQRREWCAVISASIIHEQSGSKISWNYNTFFYYRTNSYIIFCC